MNLNIQWVLGFLEGKSYFSIFIKNQSIIPEFKIIVESKDIPILYAIKKIFKCGKIISIQNSLLAANNNDTNKSFHILSIYKLPHLLDHIIPFFEKNKLKTKKRIEFEKFRIILNYLQQNKHLTLQSKIHIL